MAFSCQGVTPDLDLRKETPEQLVELIKEKLSKSGSIPVKSSITENDCSKTLEILEPRLLASNLLNKLLPAEFDNVIFRYGVPKHYLTGNAQAQKAVEVIEYAGRKENEDITQLFEITYEIAPNLKR